ncbi:MAG: hypothetical protein ACK55Z_32225, partial [bacterium]
QIPYQESIAQVISCTCCRGDLVSSTLFKSKSDAKNRLYVRDEAKRTKKHMLFLPYRGLEIKGGL